MASRPRVRSSPPGPPGRGPLLSRIWRRNAWVRSSSGSSKKCCRVPTSTILPSSMNKSLVPTSRAKPISCVTMTIVMPSSASSFIDVQDLFDQLWVEGGRDLIEQHEFRLHGQGSGDGDPLLLTVEELAPGYSACSGSGPASARPSRPSCVGRSGAAGPGRSERDVSARSVEDSVETAGHPADLGGCPDEAEVIGPSDAVDHDAPPVVGLSRLMQRIERRLAGPDDPMTTTTSWGPRTGRPRRPGKSPTTSRRGPVDHGLAVLVGRSRRFGASVAWCRSSSMASMRRLSDPAQSDEGDEGERDVCRPWPKNSAGLDTFRPPPAARRTRRSAAATCPSTGRSLPRPWPGSRPAAPGQRIRRVTFHGDKPMAPPAGPGARVQPPRRSSTDAASSTIAMSARPSGWRLDRVGSGSATGR